MRQTKCGAKYKPRGRGLGQRNIKKIGLTFSDKTDLFNKLFFRNFNSKKIISSFHFTSSITLMILQPYFKSLLVT